MITRAEKFLSYATLTINRAQLMAAAYTLELLPMNSGEEVPHALGSVYRSND